MLRNKIFDTGAKKKTTTLKQDKLAKKQDKN